MAKNVVARLRGQVEVEREAAEFGIAFNLVPVATGDLTALLDVVERFAVVEPWDSKGGHVLWCRYCGMSQLSGHATNCPALRARELCGMNDDV